MWWALLGFMAGMLCCLAILDQLPPCPDEHPGHAQECKQ
jgi:hypothetical protein